MSRTAPRIAATLLIGVALGATALAAQPARPQRAELRIATDRSSYSPGSVARLAAVVDIQDGWHL